MAEILLAFGLAAIFITVIVQTSLQTSEIFGRAKSRKELLDLYDAGSYSSSESLYGNDRIETRMDVGAGTSETVLEFSAVRAKLLGRLTDAAGNALCSAHFSSKDAHPRVTPIRLPIDPLLRLTDLEIRNGIAYLSADSARADDPDILVADIRDPKNTQILSSTDTGPGIRAIALAGKRIYGAASSRVAQLHVLRLENLHSISFETAYKLPLPYATATPAVASSIAFDRGFLYLGTEKWDGDELGVVDVSGSSPQKVGGFETDSKINAIFVHGSHAYVAASDEEQLRLLDVRNPTSLSLLDSFRPSGFSRQEGRAVAEFEGRPLFGRTSGGFNLADDHEAFAWATSSKTLAEARSLDIAGGVYGAIMDRERIYLATRTIGGELTVTDTDLSASSSVSYELPVAPQALTCDSDHIYVLAGTAPMIYEVSFNQVE